MALHKVQTFMGNQSLLQTKNKNFVIRKSNICCSEIGLLENQFPKIYIWKESILGLCIYLLRPTLH
jgi:predicted ATP-grasp superfamily ATP-dependent carboligase